MRRRRVPIQRHRRNRRHTVPRRRPVVPRLHTHHLHGGVRDHTGRGRGRQHDGAHRHTQVQGHAQLHQHIPDEPEHRGPDGVAHMHAHRVRRSEFQTGDVGARRGAM